MDSAERRKLNRLLRKPTHTGLNRSSVAKHKLVSRGLHKPTRLPSISGTTGNSTGTGDDESKTNGFSMDLSYLCGEMCGASSIQQSAAAYLQKHLTQICRLMVHSILRVMEQSRRGVPQAVDVDLASVLIGLEPAFGTVPSSFLPIRTGGRTASSGPGGKVFFIRPDKEIDVKALLLREPAGVVYDASLTAHWLAVNGRQPVSPQNPPPDFLARMSLLNGPAAKLLSIKAPKNNSSDKTATNETSGNITMDHKESGSLATKRKSHPADSELQLYSHPRAVAALSISRRPHEVSQEVMIYFRELTEACVGASESRRHEALDNATLDPGLQPILPHLVTFITEGVRVNVTNHNLAILIYLMRLVKALVDNPHISLEPYLHLLVPTVITCVLNRQLCAKPITDNHWALRDFAAKQLVTLCNRHNTSTNELYNRVTRELSRALCNWIEGVNVNSASVNLTGGRLASDTLDFTKPSSEQGATKETGAKKADGSHPAVARGGPSLGTAIHSMNTLYGILVALAEFGAQCLRILVFPLLPPLCQRLTDLVEPPASGSSSSLPPDSADAHIQFTLPSRLAPADERSFEFLKVMMTTRISSLLADWRTRQNLGTSMEDYRSAYGCMAACLHAVTRTPSTAGNSTVTVTTTTTVTTSNSTHQAPFFPKPITKSLLANSSIHPVSSAKSEDTTRATTASSLLMEKTSHLPNPTTRT